MQPVLPNSGSRPASANPSGMYPRSWIATSHREKHASNAMPPSQNSSTAVGACPLNKHSAPE